MTGEPWHGTNNGYNYHRCRCYACCEAHAGTQARMRDNARRRAQADPSLIPHGTAGGYGYWCCHCETCRLANTERLRKYAPAASP